MTKSNDLGANGPACPTWNCGDATASLHAILKYVEQQAQRHANWYRQKMQPKSRYSRWIRLWAVLLTSAGAIVPIIGQIFGSKTLSTGLWASVLVGAAAALLALDKAFGFSSGWTRYTLAATNIGKALEEFRMDWNALIAKACPNPSPDQIQALIQRAKEFSVTVEGFVLQETKDWVTEFQSNMAQLEKDTTAQLAAMKAQNDKAVQARDAAAQARAAASQPGSIQLTVPNADKADNANVQIALEDAAGASTGYTLTGTKTWVRLNLSPGHYALTVSAAVSGKTVSATAAVIVKPGEIAEPQIALPV
jgi:hypothetical protein